MVILKDSTSFLQTYDDMGIKLIVFTGSVLMESILMDVTKLTTLHLFKLSLNTLKKINFGFYNSIIVFFNILYF